MGIKKEDPFVSEIKKKLKVERNVQCVTCHKMFMYESELKGHVKAVHLKIKDFVCDNCEKSFSSKSHLNAHLSTHLENNFQCYMCGVKLARKMNLVNHMKSKHTENEKPEKVEQSWPEKIFCHHCGKLFNHSRNLRLHEKRQHSGGESKRQKGQTFSNSFKLEVLEKVKEVGVLAARKIFGIHENTIKG